ncbi:hypothetical protein M501DRAFT_1013953 [Patellaria atrata CBS 101060]|uniref:Uncharacterized protein n=1 Tax=Patellaria atrata CBS 101060 TaxID=1346257 RepID=A0A9P4VT67_9PEZI|nr:hypothetical protein M501DRAFT_1013953 [Patellaria atrata CBS 101060]
MHKSSLYLAICIFGGFSTAAPQRTAVVTSDVLATPSPTPAGIVCYPPGTPGGTCRTTAMGCPNGAFFQGYCPGGADIQCCVVLAATSATAISAGPATTGANI